MQIHDRLKDFGLTESEIKIYISLLTEGQKSPPMLARATGISRPNLYPVLENLERKGLITVQLHGKRKIYLTREPETLVNQLELRKQMMQELVPELRMMSQTTKNKPKIKFYEGVEELKNLFIEMLNTENKLIYGVASTKQLFDAIGHDFFRWWGKKLHKLKIELYDILTNESINLAADFSKTNIGEFYHYKGLPKKVGDIPSDILIWDDQVAIIALQKPVFATLIKNQAISETLRILCKQTWRSL